MELIITKNAQAGTAQYLSPYEIHNLVLNCRALAVSKGFYTGSTSVRLINESLPEGLFADFRPALNVIRIDFDQFADRMKHLKPNVAALHFKFLLAHELIHALGMLPSQGEDFEVLTDMLTASAVNYCGRFDRSAQASVLACGYLLKASFEQTGRTVTVGELSAVIESFLASYRTTPSVVREDRTAASKPDYSEFEMAVDSMKNWCKR